MKKFANEIIPINIEEELKKSYLDYAMSVIISRALPDIRDGLKPVHRRILFAMYTLGNYYNRTHKKSARIVGDVIGKYHPHGDNAVYETIVRMAQPFSMRYVLIDGQGNFGSIDGDSAAAMRYTEIRMTKIAQELLVDLEKETVNYISNYDNTEYIPDILPTRIPNLLINGSSGIAVGMATNIPPHNLSEVIDGCLAYINDENISIETLMKYIPGPDFPTAAIINGQQGIKEAYLTGRGKIYIRAKTVLERNNDNNREIIVINEIPYQVNKANLIEKIAEIIKEKRIDGIKNLRDESDKDGMRIVIEIKRDAVGKIVLNNLYSLTQLQTSFGINMVALCQNQPKTLSLKEILSAFIHHRREIIIRRTMFELRKAKEKAHILESLVVATTNINLIIDLIKKSTTPKEAKTSIIKRGWILDNFSNIIYNNKNTKLEWLNCNYGIKDNCYYFTEQQVQSILDIRLHKLTSLEQSKLINEYKEALIEIKKLTDILNNPNYLTEIIRKELLFIKKQYSDPRRTKIITNISNLNTEDLINKKDVIVTISHKGYIKYQSITEYETQKRGGKGKLVSVIKEEDFINHLLVTNTHSTILLFSSQGRIYWIKVYQLPESGRNARGKPILSLLSLNENESITAILPISNYEIGKHVFMVTANGIIKKTALTEFSRPRNNGIIAIKLNENDELIGVDITDGTNDVMLFTSYGKVVRFLETQVRSSGRTTIGIKGIKLSKGDKVVSLIIPRNKGSILTVTQHGYGKRTIQTEYSIKSRNTQGVISIKVNERNGKLVSAIQVNEFDQVMIITDTGKLVRIKVSEVGILKRNTQGVMLIRTAHNEHVIGLQRIVTNQ